MIAIIQCITTEWTKASRGAPKSDRELFLGEADFAVSDEQDLR